MKVRNNDTNIFQWVWFSSTCQLSADSKPKFTSNRLFVLHFLVIIWILSVSYSTSEADNSHHQGQFTWHSTLLWFSPSFIPFLGFHSRNKSGGQLGHQTWRLNNLREKIERIIILLSKPFNSHEWSWQNFSLQYQADKWWE